ncbi:MAG TPA: glycosyltransferase [Sphingopyxis sp.]|nr:glycosyltransferase [Sphingopyxis sp.]HMP45488.1 glycosyltransferase [Sphingopyxis sp.]HMQ19374.1 glycosyltransferase [Sphingopyxis sp.]
MTGPRLLAISLSCHEPVNRALFREIGALGIPVHLVVPRRHFVGGRWRDTPDFPPENYDLTLLDLTGTNQRTHSMKGLQAVADAFGPTHIYCDSDPASMMVRQAKRVAPNARLWSLTAENMPQSLSGDLKKALETRQPAGIASALVKAWLRSSARRKVDRVLTLSADGTALIEAMGLTATQVPLGFDPRLFQPLPDVRDAVRAELGLTRPTIAYFGRQTPEKGIHLLIDALDRIRDRDWQLLIDDFIGTSTYAAQLWAQIERLGLRDRVIVFESKHEDMVRYMNAADIVVLPSLSTPKWKEQYGRVIQEVMACSRTMVGSRSGAIPEVMGGQGHLFDEGDVEGLAALLADLLDKSDFADPTARAHALANLSVNRQAEIMAELLRREI